MGSFRYDTRGVNVHKVLNNLTDKGVRVKGCERQGKALSFKVNKRDTKNAENVLIERGFEFSRSERKSFWEHVFSLRRIGVFLGVFLCILSCIFTSFFIFKIEVVGEEKISENRVFDCLKNNGVGVGIFKSEVSVKEVEKLLKTEFDFSVVSVGIEGVTLRIKVKEELDKPYYFLGSETTPKVSTEDAVITRIVGLSGTVQVRVGESVQKGTVLIKNEKAVGEILVPARAVGEVYGRVWREREIFVPRTVSGFYDTGKTHRAHKINFSRGTVQSGSPFRYFRVEEKVTPFFSVLPIYHHDTVYFEQKLQEEENPDYLNTDCVVGKIKDELFLAVQDESGKVLRSWEKIVDVEGGKIIKVTVEMEKRIDCYG